MLGSSMAWRAGLAVALVACGAALVAPPALAGSKRAGEQARAAWPPLQLHPENHRYFLFRGKPTALVTSAEHYGAVVNLDFDYRRYLKTLKRHRFNYTRIFSGSYVEPLNRIAGVLDRNTLAPHPGRFLAPWPRSDTPGYVGGGNRFDLERWDPAYFARLKDFVAEAGRRGIVVEVTLFAPNWSNETQWQFSPLNAASNVNGVGNVDRRRVYTFDDPALQAAQEELTRKIVTELNRFDNVIFEPINEPYGGVRAPDAWQRRIAALIAETEATLPVRHLIAQNIANGSTRVENPDPNVSIFNFHYSAGRYGLPQAVDLNADLVGAIVDDENGFRGIGDDVYRREGWEFMLSGGSGFNNLDWSFSAGHEDGSDVPLDPRTPGGGTPTLRRHFSYLVRFLDRLPLVRMRPDDSVIESGVPAGARAQALVQDGRAYGIYVNGDGVQSLRLRLPAGGYSARWIDPKTGDTVRFQRVHTSGGAIDLDAPAYSQDVALRVLRPR
jgi:hypothetical protein